MKLLAHPNLLRIGAVFLLVSATVFASAVSAQEQPAAASADADAAAPLTLDEMKVLAAPIALYPDDLVALCVAASLYPVQIVQAARFLEEKTSKPNLEPSDKWDGSVISLLNYPEVITMMNDDLDWTEQLGTVAANQQKDLLLAIQQLREEAVAKDVLKSTEQVKVVSQGDNVLIQSADPKTIYVPTYPPEMLYDPNYVVSSNPIVYEPYPSYYYPTAPYWAGFVTGAAFAAVVDWDHWGTWGGDVDIDVDIGDRVDIDFDKIDIDKIDVDKLKNIDFRNIDPTKLNLKNTNIDRDKLKRNLESKDFNNIARKAKTGEVGNVRDARAHDLRGKDVRKNVAEGLKNNPNAKLPKSGTSRPDAQRIGSDLQKARPNVDRPAAQKVTQKKVARPKPAQRVDNRPRQPSAMGNPRPGRIEASRSNRGAQSRGGGQRGGAHRGGGGGGRMHRR